MTAATADPVAREELDRFLAGLSDDEKWYVIGKLVRPVLKAATAGPIDGVYAFEDADGTWLGDLVPAPRLRPGDPTELAPWDQAYLDSVPKISVEEARRRRAASTEARKRQPADQNGTTAEGGR
ncbi:MAG: hypothetical protein K2X82_19985 [Gemmataceae bacterium]|nr:hypothetical protein [Gemmataceae bacterium]